MVAISSATRSADIIRTWCFSPVMFPGIIWFLSKVIHTSESSGIRWKSANSVTPIIIFPFIFLS